jgi:hypothetical protein
MAVFTEVILPVAQPRDIIKEGVLHFQQHFEKLDPIYPPTLHFRGTKSYVAFLVNMPVYPGAGKSPPSIRLEHFQEFKGRLSGTISLSEYTWKGTVVFTCWGCVCLPPLV